MLHVFREKGDLIVGAEVPVVLGLRTLDLRADIIAAHCAPSSRWTAPAPARPPSTPPRN
ncbi:hypothetical protein LP419_15175 [Massilia sp. H-1]|nr:hypothetical protein LP419_15175 [Massilia sp. H-1]